MKSEKGISTIQNNSSVNFAQFLSVLAREHVLIIQYSFFLCCAVNIFTKKTYILWL